MKSDNEHRRFGLVPAIWCAAIALLVNGLAMVLNRIPDHAFPADISLASSVQAAPATGEGMRLPDGTYLLPAQLGRNDWGFMLIDPQRHVLAVYRILPSASRIRLLAVRDYRYDLLLKDFNNSSPTPFQVKGMVQSVKPAAKP